MTNEEFDEKVNQIKNNQKVIEAYEKLYSQMKQVEKVIENSEVNK